jgi:hypothetical protein
LGVTVAFQRQHRSQLFAMITTIVANAQLRANTNTFSPLLLDQLREFCSNELRQQLIHEMRPEFLAHFNDRDGAVMHKGIPYIIIVPFLLLIL